VAYHFPPENAAGAARPYRFYRYLPEFHVEPRVYTAARPGHEKLPGVVHIPDELGSYWQQGGPKPPMGLSGYGELFFRRYVVIAAVGFNWSRRVAHEIARWKKTLGRERLTVISTYPPVGALLAPLWMPKRDFRIVLDYRDPFSSAPEAGELRGNAAKWIDRRAIRGADLVIANSDSAAELFRSNFPQDAAKVHAIWNGFDPEEAISAAAIPERPGPVIAHVGAIYVGRSPDAVLAAVERLRASGLGRLRELGVSLVGPLGYGAKIDAALVERGRKAGWLHYVPEQIPQADARRIAAEADYLLLLQPQSSVQVPAKLFEYLRIGRPVLAYAPKDSAIEWLLERAGIPFQCIYPGEAAETADAKVRKLVETPPGPYPASSWFLDRFDARNQTRHLTELIRQIP
jgi:glycosyltransferase involved in cell wall biosynthesis